MGETAHCWLSAMITEEDEKPVGFSVWDDRHTAGFVTS